MCATTRTSLLLVVLLLGIGCSPIVTRQDKPTRYTHCAIETPHAEVRERAAHSVAGSLSVVSADEIKDRGVTNSTIILRIEGSRGFWHCNGKGTFLDLVTRKPVVTIHARRGMFYMGQDAAIEEVFALSSAEAATLSGMAKP
jgi:hypothetical protein